MSEELWALEQLARARRLQDWMFAELRPSAPGPMLEVGAGIGTHIEDDSAAVASIVDSLAPGGELAVLMPAHPRPYGRLDRQFGHVRRYMSRRLRQLLAGASAELVSLRNFNLLGVPGRFVAGPTARLGISDGTLAVYESLVRAWRPLEDALHPPFGLSLVARAQKP